MDGYRFTVKVGDKVRLPGGGDGVVTEQEYHLGGNSLAVTVKPDRVQGFWANLVWRLSKSQYTYYDKAVDALDRFD